MQSFRRRFAGSASGVVIPRWRVQALFLVFVLVFGRVALRLGELQVVRHQELKARASAEISQQITLQPRRGTITDRHGNVLAIDADRESLWVVPSEIKTENAPLLAQRVAAITKRDVATVLAAMTNYDYYWLPIARWMEPDVAEQIDALAKAEPGLRLMYEPRRLYPQGEFASHVVGAVNLNGEGISGIEAFYNSTLKGITGTLVAEFDGTQQPISIAPQEMKPAEDGADLELTIDPYIQYVAERELKAAMEKHKADGGSIIVMEVNTGAIRAMASWPTFNPYNYMDYAPEIYSRNPAISALYEPGSTFKIATVSAGLETHAFTADTAVNDTGVVSRYGWQIHNWNYAGAGMITPEKVLYYSSNIGALLLNEITGPDRFYPVIRRFGFGSPTGIDLGGEEGGIVPDPSDANYSELKLITNAYGQGISVTPLQIAQMVATIGNDGVLMRPYLVQKRCKEGTCIETQPHRVARVVDSGVAWTVREMLVHSANHYAPVVWGPKMGSYSDQWLVPGFRVGAKTGTSSVVLPNGGYDEQYTIGSVAGIAPVDRPRYAIIVKIDRPKDDIWGVSTAIPVYYNVVDALLRYDRLPPDVAFFSPGQE